MLKPSIKSTVYPFDYDKNVNSDRNSKRFASNFNQWAADIHESLMPTESIMNARLDEAKQLLMIKK